MAAYRYLRIFIKSTSPNVRAGASNIEVAETLGGPDVSGSATITAESITGANGPNRAFDANGSTFWASDAIPAGDYAWIQIDFGAGNEREIRQIRVLSSDQTAILIDGLRLEAGDDTASLTVLDTFNDAFGLSETKSYPVSILGGGGGGPTTLPSTKVTQISAIIPDGQTTLTLTNGVDYTLTDTDSSKWFARISNTRHTGMGRTSSGNNQNAHDFTARLVHSGNNIVITREGSTNDNRVAVEIIECLAPAGSPEQWIVRERGVKSFAAAALLGSYANPGSIASTGDCVIWITGQSTTNTGRDDVNDHLFMARFNGANFEIERRNGTFAADPSYAIVEYVGANWSIQHQEFTPASTNHDGTISPALSDFSKTFHHAQTTYGAASGGLDDLGAASEITSNNNINFITISDSVASQRHSIWFISNDGLTIQRVTGTMAGTGEEEVEDVTIASVALNETSVFGSSDSTGGGIAWPRGLINLFLLAATTLRLRQSDNGQTSRYSVEVVTWPEYTVVTSTGRTVRVKVGGTYVVGVVKVKIEGVYVEKPVKVKQGGVYS